MHPQSFFLHFLYISFVLTGASFVLLAVGVGLSYTQWWRRIALFHTQTLQQGYIAPQYSQLLVGQHGLTQTPLRPAGKVLIQGRIYQATTEGTYIASQVGIVIIAIMGHTLVVEPSI